MTLKEGGESYEGLPGLSRTIPSAFFREGVKSVGQQGVEEGGKNGGLDAVYRPPHRVWDLVGARGRGVRAFRERPGYLFGGEGGIVLVPRKAEEEGRRVLGRKEVVNKCFHYLGRVGGAW